jgi:RecA-family ATPase
MLAAGMADGADVNMLRGIFENANVPRDARWQARYDDIPRAVSTAREKYAPVGQEAEPPPQPLQWLDMSNWDNEPRPEREWAIRDRVPLKQVGLFSGEGGTGKSIVEMMKDVGHVAAKDWLGSMPEPGSAFYIGAEDDQKEIHIRFHDIAEHYGVTFKQLIDGGLHVLPLLGQDATLCAASGKSGRVEVTALYRRLYEAAGDIKPINISIDTLSRAFAGSELDRVQVYAFAMHMQAMAMVAGGSVTVLSHPSLAGIASGSGISGSTAWHGAFRFRQYLTSAKVEDGEQPDNNLRQFEFKKNQYGPIGDTITLRYQRGLFLPVGGMSSLDRLARAATVDDVFMTAVKKFEGRGQELSPAPKSHSYGPTIVAQQPEAKGIRKAELAGALDRLIEQGKLCIEIRNSGTTREKKVIRACCS